MGMTCSDCGAPHSQESPLTVTGAALLCPACLDLHNAAQAAIDSGADPYVVLRRMGVPIVAISRMRQKAQQMRDAERAVLKPIRGTISLDGGKTWIDVKSVRME